MLELVQQISPEEFDDSSVYFSFHYVTDELVFFGLKKQSGKVAFQLANFLFNALLHNEIFEVLLNPKLKPTKNAIAILSKWHTRLVYFLSWFPEKRKSIASLRTQEQAMQSAIHSVLKPDTQPTIN